MPLTQESVIRRIHRELLDHSDEELELELLEDVRNLDELFDEHADVGEEKKSETSVEHPLLQKLEEPCRLRGGPKSPPCSHMEVVIDRQILPRRSAPHLHPLLPGNAKGLSYTCTMEPREQFFGVGRQWGRVPEHRLAGPDPLMLRKGPSDLQSLRPPGAPETRQGKEEHRDIVGAATEQRAEVAEGEPHQPSAEDEAPLVDQRHSGDDGSPLIEQRGHHRLRTVAADDRLDPRRMMVDHRRRIGRDICQPPRVGRVE